MTRSTPSQSFPAASPRGIGVTTGPKKALPVEADYRGSDVDPDEVHAFVVGLDDRLVEVGAVGRVEQIDSGSPTSAIASASASASRRFSLWKRVPIAV